MGLKGEAKKECTVIRPTTPSPSASVEWFTSDLLLMLVVARVPVRSPEVDMIQSSPIFNLAPHFLHLNCSGYCAIYASNIVIWCEISKSMGVWLNISRIDSLPQLEHSIYLVTLAQSSFVCMSYIQDITQIPFSLCRKTQLRYIHSLALRGFYS